MAENHRTTENQTMSEPLSEETMPCRRPPTKAQLRAWLRALPATRRFGTNPDDCVIAQYTGHETGFTTCGPYTLAPWLEKFIREFCEGRGRGPKTALRILEKIR